MPAGAARWPASSRRPSPRWSGSAPRAAHPRRARADDPPANYEVGPDLIDALRRRGPGAASASSRPAARDGHALFDLAGYIGARLARAGVGQIEDLGLCTYADAGALFQLPPHDPSRRSRLRPPRQRHRAEPSRSVDGRCASARANAIRRGDKPRIHVASRRDNGSDIRLPLPAAGERLVSGPA